MVELDDKKAAELESLQDEVYSRLANRYGLSKGEIAKLAVKRYGGEIMTEKTDEILSNVRTVVGGGGDAMDKMMTWEMIKDMRSQRASQPLPVQQPQQVQQPQLQQQPEKMNMQELMMMMIMPQMAKSMGGGEDEILKIFKYKMMMGGEDGKGMDMQKLEQLLKEERAETDARMEQMMNVVVGRQEAEKIREREEKWRRELEQKVVNAEQIARHPTEPQQVIPSAKEKLDEGLDMLSHVKGKMEDTGMIQTPKTIEDKQFELDKMGIGHKQGVESKAVDSLAKSVDKFADTADKTLNKGIDLMAKEQEVKERLLETQTPEGREKLQRRYETLGNQVLQEEHMESEEPEQPLSEGESLDYVDEDDFDAE